MSTGITVIGGIGGTHARLEDLDRAVVLLRTVVAHLEMVGRAARAGSHIVSGIDTPPELVRQRDRTAAEVARIDMGSGGATGTALEIEDIACNLKETVHLLEEAEASAQSSWAWIGRAWDKALTLGSVVVWIPRKVAGAGAGTVAHTVEDHTPSWMPVHWMATGGSWVADAVNPDWTPNLAPLVYGDDLQGVVEFTDGAFRLTTVIPRHLAEEVGINLPDDLVEALSGVFAGVSLALDEILGDMRDVMVFPVTARATHPPGGMADLLGRLENLSPGGVDGESRIAIDRIENQDGTRSWIVEIPGTQDWIPNGGDNPLDSTSNFLLMSDGESDLTRAVDSAMGEVGIRPGEEVLLVGHSQGGIAAMALASTPSFTDRYAVSAVLTAGAPVGKSDPAPGITVLSIEHPSDTVPALDGTSNPDRTEWITVRRDLGASDSEIDRQADGDIVMRHELETYTRTAAVAEGRPDVSVQRWLDDTEAFWTADGRSCTRIVFETTRSTAGLATASILPAQVPSTVS